MTMGTKWYVVILLYQIIFIIISQFALEDMVEGDAKQMWKFVKIDN